MTQPVTPELADAGMDVAELADGAKDVIASTAERFTSVIEGLLQHLSLENVILQIAAVFISMAIVMGPTPPGTGVMAEATSRTAS